MTDLQIMISLIEGEYQQCDRNTPEKMITLIKKEFDKNVSKSDILNFYGLQEDYEKISWQVDYGHYYY